MKRNISDRTIICVVLFFAGIVLGISGHIALLFLCCISALSIYTIRLSDVAKLKRLGKKPAIRKKEIPNSEKFLKRLIKYRMFSLLYDSARNTAHASVPRTGQTATPGIHAKNAVIIFFASLFVAAAVALFGILSGIYYLAASLAVPLVVYLFPKLSVSVRVSERTTLFDEEIAYFLSYLQIVHSGTMMIYRSIAMLDGKNIFPGLESDGLLLKKWVEYDATVQIDAINELAQNHPHKTFKQFLIQYCSIAKSSVDNIPSFIAESAKTEFARIVQSAENAIGKAAMVFIMGALMMVMAPVLLVMMSFIGGVDDSTTHHLINFLTVMPVIYTVMVFFMFKTRQDSELYPKKIAFVALPVIFVLCYLITRDAMASFALACAVPCVINGRAIASQMRYIRQINDNFPIFLRDLIESRKIDANFIVSLKKLASGDDMESRYGAYAGILRQMRMRLEDGNYHDRPLIYDRGIPSWRLRMLTFIFQTIYDADRGDIATLERMHKFTVSINEIKNKLSDSVSLSSLMLYASSPLFFVVLVAMSVFMGSFSSVIPDLPDSIRGSADASLFFEKPDFASLLSSLKPAFLVMSMCSGLVISRVVYSTFSATLPVGICASVAFVIVAFWDRLFEVLSGLLLPLFSF